MVFCHYRTYYGGSINLISNPDFVKLTYTLSKQHKYKLILDFRAPIYSICTRISVNNNDVFIDLDCNIDRALIYGYLVNTGKMLRLLIIIKLLINDQLNIDFTYSDASSL